MVCFHLGPGIRPYLLRFALMWKAWEAHYDGTLPHASSFES